MQLFIDNWSAVLLSAASASATTLDVAPDACARLTGLGGAAYYRLTLAEVDVSGREVAWEVVRVTAAGGSQLTVARLPGARAWPAGTRIEARLTAAALAELASATTVGGATDLLAVQDNPAQVELHSSTGTGAVIVGASATAAGVMTAADKLALDYLVQAGAAQGGGAPPVLMDAFDYTPPPPLAVGQLLIFRASLWLAHNTLSPWGWKKLGEPVPQIGVGASTTEQSSAPGAVEVLTQGYSFYAAQGESGETLYNVIELPLLPAGAATLDPLVCSVDELTPGATHALRVRDDAWSWTDISLTTRAGLVIQTDRQARWLELRTTTATRYTISLDTDDGAGAGVTIIAEPIDEQYVYDLGWSNV